MKYIKRKDERWQANIELPKDANGKRNRKCIIANTRSELKIKVADAMQKLNAGYNFKTDKLTVKEYLEYWLKVYCKGRELTTINGYENYINNHIIPSLGNVKLAKLLPLHIQNFYNDEAEKKYKGKTILQEHRILHKALSDALKNGLLAFNPIDRVDAPHEEDPENKIPDPETFAKMLEAAKGTVNELPIILAGVLGLRRSEVFALTWKDIDFKKGILTVRKAVIPVKKKLHIKGPKNKSSFREIALPEKVIEIFKKHRKLPGVSVCLNEKGTPLSVKSYNSRFTNLLKKHGIEHFKFHALRHYNATLMLWLGIDSKKAAQRLGHSTPAITQKLYQHVTWDMDKEVAAKINNTI